MRTILFAAIMQLCAFTLFAQQTVKGRVLDENDQPLVAATVSIGANAQSTDENGHFSFQDVKGEKATLKVTYVGYEHFQKVVSVPFNGDIHLQKSLEMLQEVTVSSLRATDKSPIAFTNLDKKTLAKTNLGQDVPYLLQQTPSFVATSDAGTGIGYTGFRIRGTDASRINVTINGIPYNDADEQGTYWVDIPDFVSSVENLQVQRGVGTSTNGAGAFGANINMQTSNFAPKAMGEVDLSGGSFGTKKATVRASTGLINGHWALDSRVSSITSNGYIDRGSVDLKSYFIQAGYYSDNTTIKFLTFGGTEKTYHAWDGVPADSLATHRTYNDCGYMGMDANGKPMYYKNQTDNYIQNNYQLLGIHSFSPEFSMNVGLHYTHGIGYYEEYKQDQTLQEYSIPSYTVDGNVITSSDLVRQQWMSNDFVGGVFSLNYEKKDLSVQLGGALNRYWGPHWGDVTWLKNYVGDMRPNDEYYRNHVNKWDGNIYLKANYNILPTLNAYADLQYRHVLYQLNGQNNTWDYNTNAMQALDVNKLFNFFNPKLGLLYHPDKNNTVFASYAIANREPTRTNYTDATKDTWPTSERLYDTEVGYKYQGKSFAAGVNGYYMDYKNQLILTGKIDDIGEMLTENIAKSYRTGIELVAGVKATDWLKWNGTVTFSRNRIQNFSEYVDVYDVNWNWIGQQQNDLKNTPIAFSPDVTGNSMFTFTKGGFEGALQSIYVGKQYVDNTGSSARSLDAYFLNNIRLSYHLPIKGIQGIDFTMLFNNIFNEMYISNAWVYSYYYQESATKTSRYNDFGYYPQAGFNMLGGITVKF